MKSRLFIVLVLISLIRPVFGQVSFTVNVTNPGTISEVIGDRVGITNLTVNGTIDARDFRVLRDMSLVSLDLSGATIAEVYEWEAGHGVQTHHLANIIPNNALLSPHGNTTLVSLKLPATITGIGNLAIASMQTLTSITLPATLRYFDYGAFAYSPGLQNVDFSACNMLDSIGSAAFQECNNLAALDLSKCTSLTKIGSGAFWQCLGLNTVILPSSLITLKDNAFGNCPGLSSIDFSKCKSLKTIDDFAFYGCPQLFNLDLSLCTSLDSINSSAVSGCSSLQTVKLPSSLRYIGEGSFAMDTSLVTVDFSNCTNLKVIGKESFQYCYAIQKLDLSNCSALDSISFNAFYQCNKIEEIDLPESIRTIGGDAFYFLEDHLKIVRIKNPVPPQTGWASFSIDEKNLAVLYVPVGSKKAYQESDGSGTWAGFSYIVEDVSGINPKSIKTTSPGNLANRLTSEEKLTLTHLKIQGYIDARDIKTIRDEMPALTEIDLSSAQIEEYSGYLGTMEKDTFYPQCYLPAYSFINPVTKAPKNSLTSVYIPLCTRKIGGNAFAGCMGLKTIDLQSVSIIEGYAFADCKNLSSIDFSKAVVLDSIGSFAFANCNNIGGEIDFSNTWFANIGQGAFFNCNKITSVKFPETPYLTTIADSAFMNCSGITSFDFPASTKTIGEKAFFNSGLKGTAIFPHDIDIIGYQAFSKCSGLTSFVIDGDNQWPLAYSSIDGVLFDETKTKLVACPNGKSGLYQVPDTVKIIGGYAFDQCTGLTGIELPLALTSIEKYGLGGCVNLGSIKIYNPLPPNVGIKVFNGVNTGTCKLYVPKGSKTAYQAANQWKDFANIIEMEGDLTTDKTLNLTQAGTLSSWLSAAEKAAVTKLTLTGNIDARDFKTMRDEMPNLEYLNLSDAIVDAYSGTLGTLSNDTTYESNEIPIKGFNSLTKPLILSSLLLPKTVKRLCFAAIANCQRITSLQLPDHLSVIEQGAFSAFGVQSFTIPRDVEFIGPGAFMAALNLKAFEVENGNNYFTTVNGILYDKEFKRLISIPLSSQEISSFQIPETVELIDNSAFYRSDRLTKVIFSENIKTIADFAFSTCSNLSGSIDLSGCKQLSSIGNRAFSNNSKIAEFILPSSLKYIGTNAFLSCPSITKFTIMNPIPPDLGLSVFFLSPTKTCTLYVPKGSKTAYQAANQWKYFANIVEMEGGVATEKTLNLTQAGALSSLLTAAEKAAITKLTLTGNIDARDFKTMRDEMPLLADIDLSNASISAYNGIYGTSPWGNNNYPSNTIPEAAFMQVLLDNSWQGKLSLTSVTLPASLVAIDQNAFFACMGLSTMTIPSSITTIGDDTFSYCFGLYSVSIPASVTNIGLRAFGYSPCLINVDAGNPNYSSVDGDLFNKTKTVLLQCSASKSGLYTILSTVIDIESWAFWECSKLNEIVIPSSVKTIGTSAFRDCSGLTSVTIPSSVVSIDQGSFEYCSGLNSITIYWPIPLDLTLYPGVFMGTHKSNCILNVPHGTVSLYSAANQWKDFTHIVEMEGDVTTEKTLNLTQAGTLSSLLTVAEKAAITKLTLTGNIDARDFKTMRDEMPLLEDLNLLNSTIVLYYGSGGTISLDYTSYPADEVPAKSFYKHQNLSKVVLPSKAIKIGQEAFRSCANLKTVEIPPSVFVIDVAAFYMSHQMESVFISSTVTTIDALAFSDCSALIVVDANNSVFSSIDGILFNKDQSVLIQAPNTVSGVYSIPSTVKTVQHDAFLACSKLTSIIIPSPVQVIGDFTFAYCTGLTSIKIYSAIPVDISAVWDATLEGIKFSACSLYVPKGSKAAYQSSLGWKEFTNIVEMEGGLSSDVTLNLTQAGILSSLLTAAEKAAVTKLTLTGNIDARDFKTMRDEMPLLVNVDLSQATIMKYTGKLGTLENESTTYAADAIPPYSFSHPSEFKLFKLKSIAFPNNLKSIGFHAFYNSCPELTSIAIPKYVETIEDGAFSYCNQIKAFIVSVDNEYLSSINGVIFNKDVSELIVYPGAVEGTYQVPQKVKRIANTAFEGKWKLTSVQLPEGLEEIGDVAFSSCQFESVNFPESLVYIGYNAFITCTNLTAIDLSNCSKLTSLNRNTFNYCTSLAEVKLPATITYIDSWAFRDCNKLSSFTIKNPIPPDLGTDVFLNASTSSCTLYVRKGSKAAYQVANQWKDFYTIRELDYTGSEIYPELNGWMVYSSNGQLVVEGCDRNSLVTIFSITGQKIFVGKSESNFMRIDLNKNQTYIVRVNNESKKIVHQ